MDDEKEFQFPDEKVEEFEFEIEDDTPEKDRGREAMPKEVVEDLDKDELEEYSDTVKTKLKQFKKVWHDERREKEQALREQKEALAYAQTVQAENKALKTRLTDGEQNYLAAYKDAAELEIDAAKRSYKEAYDLGDSDLLVNAQEKLSGAQYKLQKAKEYVPALQTPEIPVNSQTEIPKPDSRAMAWQERDEGEHGRKRVAAALGAAGIGHFQKGVAKGFELAGPERAAGSAARGQGGLAVLGQMRSTHQHVGLRVEGLEPEFLGPPVGQVEVGVVLGKALGIARASPVGGLVNRAVVAFRIAEAFGQQRPVAVLGLPLGRQFAQAAAEALRGEIGPAGLFGHQKAAQLHDELEPPRAGDRIPADDRVAVLDMPRRGAPDEHGNHPPVLGDELAKAVAGLLSRAEEMLPVEHLMGDLPVRRAAGGPDFQHSGGRCPLAVRDSGLISHAANRAF